MPEIPFGRSDGEGDRIFVTSWCYAEPLGKSWSDKTLCRREAEVMVLEPFLHIREQQRNVPASGVVWSRL